MNQTLSYTSQPGTWLRLDRPEHVSEATPVTEDTRMIMAEKDDDYVNMDDSDTDTYTDSSSLDDMSMDMDLGTWTDALMAAPAEQKPAPRRPSAILQIPADVLVLISDYLDTPSALSLSLTCRCAYALCFRPTFTTLAPNDKRNFLQLMERDPIMPGVYYCHGCNILHPFRRDWGPHSQAEVQEKTRDGFHCGRKDRFAPNWNNFDLSYAHARLVMNRHLHGPEHGLPLENICIDQTLSRENTAIHAQTAARIIDDELFVRRTYSFSISDTPAALDAFRRCSGARDFRVCEHTAFFSNSSVYRQYIPEIQRRPDGATLSSAFVPCADAPGSCGLCLMDFEVCIAAPSSPAGEGEDPGTWDMTIRAYHRLGACRAPDDWRWARFSESSRPHLFFPNRPNRRGSNEHPGAVRKLWLDAEEADVAETQTPAEQQAPSQPPFVPAWESVSPFHSAHTLDSGPLVDLEKPVFVPLRVPGWVRMQGNAPMVM